MSKAILTVIQQLAKQTESSYSAAGEVRKAFTLGLWYKSFPEYVLEDLNKGYHWDLVGIDKEASNVFNFESHYPNLFKFQFISDTGDSWHQCYRDFRSLGWERLKVHREGGILQYLLRNSADDLPEGFRQLNLLLDISIGTCKQVQVGTKMVEQPIFETKCDELVDLPEGLIKQIGDGETITDYRMPAAEVIPLVVIDDISEVDLTAQGGPDVGEAFSKDIEAPLDVRTRLSQSFQDRADAAFQDAADSYLPEPASDEGSSSSQFEDDVPF